MPSGNPEPVVAKAAPLPDGKPGAADRSLWSALRRDWPIWLVASTTFLSGAVSVLQVVFPRIHERFFLFTYVLPFGLHEWSRSTSAIFGFMLVYLSFNLFQRRRMAMWLSVIVSLVLVPAHILSGALWYLAVAPATAATLLYVLRKRFTVKSEPGSITRGVILMAFSIAFAIVYGTLGFWRLSSSEFGAHFSFADSVVKTLRQITLVANSDLITHTRQAGLFMGSLTTLGIVAWVFAAYSLFRPVAYRLQVLPEERALAKALLERHGRSPYDFFKAWHDKSTFFSDTRQSFIAYANVRGVALSLGDPVGPEDEMEKVIGSFLGYCGNNGWEVCFVFPDHLPVYKRLGLHVLKIGEEAVVGLEHFSLHTSQSKYFRYQRRRFERDGFRFARHSPPHPAALLAEVEEVSKEWLSLPNHRELGFLQGRFERSYVEHTHLSVVRDAEGKVVAFVNEIPSYTEGEAVLDMMRHRLKAPNATMDYLFQELMLALKEDGYRSFNLGVAPFSGVGREPGAPFPEKAMGLLYRLNWFVSAQGLRRYKAKYEPEWKDRYVAYTGGPFGLVRMALSVTKAVEG